MFGGGSLTAAAHNLTADRPSIPIVGLFKHSKETGPLALFPLRTEWTLALNNALTAQPAWDETRAYFPIEGDRLVAYDLISGRQLWLVTIRTNIGPSAGADLVFVMAADGLVALHAADGSVAWHLPLDDPLAMPLVWDTGWLIASTKSGAVMAFRGDDGTMIWRTELGSPASARPSLAADRVYVPLADGRVVALRLDDGGQVWQHRLGGAATDLLPLEDRIFVGSKDNFFYCLKTRDGSPEWRWRTGADIVGVPAVDEDNVYFLSFDNVLRALHRTSGVQRWKRPLTIRPTHGLLKAGDTLIVSGPKASQGFSAKDGTPAGDIPLPADLAAPPHLFERRGAAVPSIIVCVQDLANGATIAAVTRRIEPEIGTIGPLPNPTVLAPPQAAPPKPSR